MAPFLFVQKSIRRAEKNGIIPVFRNKLKLDSKESIKYEKIAKIRKNEEIREIKSYHERKKENYKNHAIAKRGGKHYSKNHQVALE